uniref:Serpin domain-containing protein n=1 Tax=Oreochromis niloticus TaxID=8128 RepID=A0A669DCS1_ORENI
MGSAISLSEANSAFSLALFKQLSNNNKTGNIFFSPFSISSALAMVMLGARGNTATQMSEVRYTRSHTNTKIIVQNSYCSGTHLTHAGCSGVNLSSCWKPLTDARFTFTVANRLYREKSCPFTQVCFFFLCRV